MSSQEPSRHRLKGHALVAAFIAAALPSTGTAAADLTVTVAGLRSTDGSVQVALYNSAETFPKSDGMMERHVVPAAAPVTGFTGLEPGTYAIAVYHDENDNDEFDQGLFGIPLEGYGFSRDARVFFGPPSFAEAAFAVDPEGAAITVPMTYWQGAPTEPGPRD